MLPPTDCCRGSVCYLRPPLLISLQARREIYPSVSRDVPNSSFRCREIRIGKAAGRYSNLVGKSLAVPKDGRTAFRAKMVLETSAALRCASKRLVMALNRDQLSLVLEEGGDAEGTTSSLLAIREVW